MSQKLVIKKYSHFVKMENLPPHIFDVVEKVIDEDYTEYKPVRNEKGFIHYVKDKVFAYISNDGKEIRLHINQIDSFKNKLNFYGFCYDDIFEEVEVPVSYSPSTFTFNFTKSMTARDYQEEIINDVMKLNNHRKIISLPTGKGKTFTAYKCCQLYGKRVLVTALPRYMPMLENAADKTLLLKKKDMMVISKSSELLAMLSDDYQDDINAGKYPVIVLSLVVLKSYIDDYNNGLLTDAIPPDEIYSRLKIGIRITDEVHQFFHANFIIDLFTHMPLSLHLSATLEPGSDLVKRMYDVMYPKTERMGIHLIDKYVRVKAVMYGFKSMKGIRYTGFMQCYSHTKFETTLLKPENKKRLENYFTMVAKYTQLAYINGMKEKQTCLIFFATKEMCSKFAKYLKAIYPGLNINRYISDDKYEILMESDIAISTLGSAGTAIDKPNLKTVIMTVALNSPQANIQAIGRLRVLVGYDSSEKPIFVYFNCFNIEKHILYHKQKFDLFNTRAITFDVVKYPMYI